ncbi:MAG: phosphodiester glycosidase family protein, partial [Alicyclobacillaceae bacterium]|nr:phosphodiester glycosidase family protein [Alicyclobacillaceae bacterium]
DEISFSGNLNVKGTPDATTTGSTVSTTDATITIDGLNRNQNANDKVVLFTPIVNQLQTVIWDSNSGSNPFYSNGAYAVVTGVNDPSHLKPGQTYEGIVQNVVANTSATDAVPVPSDGVVIAGFGSKADFIRNHLTTGAHISFQFDVYQGDRINNDIVQAVSGYNWLVQNGQAWTRDQLLALYGSSLVDAPNARTAVGLTRDGKLIMLTVDKPSFSFADSTGVDLPTLGQAMQSLGAEVAVGFDGGGSTTMVVKEEGVDGLSVANHPSDGSPRPVTNGLWVVSTAPQTAEIGKVMVSKDITIFKNASYNFSVRATDRNGNPVDVSTRTVQYKANFGTIDNSGHYTAPDHAVNDMVFADIGGVTGFAKVNVVDSLGNFDFAQQGTLVLRPGDQVPIAMNAYDTTGQPIVVDGSSFDWQLSDPSIGTIQNGVLKINPDVKNGTTAQLTAKCGNVEKSLNLVIGLQTKLMDDFENRDIGNYKKSYAALSSYDIAISSDLAKSGTMSLKLTYNYGGWTGLNGAMYVYYNDWDTNPALRTDIMPKKLGIWVYSDGSNYVPWLRAYVKDGDGNTKLLNLTGGNERWTGWRFVQGDINPTWKLPLKIYGFYSVETDKTHQHDPNFGGTIYFDDVQWVYDDSMDLQGPSFSNASPAADTVYTADVPLSVTISDDKSGVDSSSIHVTLDGKDVQYTYDPVTGKIAVQASGLTEGQHEWTVNAKDKAGNPAIPSFDRKFTVNRQKDTTPPTITTVLPLDGSTIHTPTPRIAARINDAMSGVDVKDITMTLDGRPLTPGYDEKSGVAWAIPGVLSA